MSVMQAPRSRGAEITVAGMRILLGLLFLTVWASNLHKGLYSPHAYANLIDGYVVDGDAPGAWKGVMRFVAGHAEVFARLQLVGELALGTLLVLGLRIREVGIAAWGFLLSLWISELGAPGEWAWSLVFPGVVALAVAFLQESRLWSLDSRLRARGAL